MWFAALWYPPPYYSLNYLLRCPLLCPPICIFSIVNWKKLINAFYTISRITILNILILSGKPWIIHYSFFKCNSYILDVIRSMQHQYFPRILYCQWTSSKLSTLSLKLSSRQRRFFSTNLEILLKTIIPLLIWQPTLGAKMLTL